MSFWYPFDEPLVLASRSPRRREILTLAGIPFQIAPSDVDEENDGGDPSSLVLRHSLAKASHIAAGFPGRVVLGADTLVHAGGRVLGKPRDAEEAAEMLSILSGRWHEVYGGVAIICEGVETASFHEVTRVRFRDLSRGEIGAYVETGEPMDKAGAYGIQGYGCVLVDRIEGCYFNVMGLPVARTATALTGMAARRRS
jgi:septum formation protein